MSAGRPSDYKPEYCEQVIAYGKEGKSVTQMACYLGVVKSTIYLWAETHPEFSDAFAQAKQWSQDWWESKGQEGLAGGVNPALWSRSMAARFPEDYTERQKRELTGANGGPVEQITRVEVVAVEANGHPAA